jgi:UPF0716 protein FxsA
MPHRELADGALVLIGGTLLMTPGFVSDVLGILLLLPPVRFALRGYARRRLVRRVDVYGFDGFDGFDDPGGRGRPGRPYDYDA